MSITPPAQDVSTGMTPLTFGSALTDTCLTAPVVRSATSADLLSGPMIKPLVLSRQPCITPGAGHSFGNGLSGSGGGGAGVELGGGAYLGSVVNGADAASLNRAQPVASSRAASSADSATRVGSRVRMPARLRTVGPAPPGRHESRPLSKRTDEPLARRATAPMSRLREERRHR